jgi:NAD(P)-dependent dehydrogenase (short-subunit alcohol dehydrogenase family)
MEKLGRERTARVIMVNSEGHRFAIEGLRLDDLGWNRRHYTGLRSYGSAKTAQLLSMSRFDAQLSGSGVTINAMHPGEVRTSMGENNGRIYRFFKHRLINSTSRDPELSAKALYYLGIAPQLSGVSGKFFNLTTEETPAPHALDTGVAADLWETSLRLAGLS